MTTTTPIIHTKDIDGLFFPKLDTIAAELWAHPADLLAVWFSESGMRADAWNNGPATIKDKETGLMRPTKPEERYNASGFFQAMPATLKGLAFPGDHAAFRRLNATSQLDWARRYYLPYRGKLGSIGQIYTANFLPALIDHSSDPNFVLTAKKGPLPWAFTPNAVFDTNGDLAITVGELQAAVQRNARGPRWAELLARMGVADMPVADPQPEGIDLGTTLGIQRALDKLGFPPGPLDGYPGPKTRAAVVAFQTQASLQVDGIVGPKTRGALQVALAA